MTTGEASAVRLETITCNLCGSSKQEHELLFEIPDLVYELSDLMYQVVRCQRCRLVFVNPRPVEEDVMEMYSEEYYDTSIAPEVLLAQKEPQLKARARFLPQKPGRLLDVGCQKGEFLYYAAQLGWETVGVELSEKPPNPFGQKILQGSLLDLALSPSQFDVITFWAVLEHVYDPMAHLKEAFRLLRPGGQVIFLVTNIESPTTRYFWADDVPRHTTLFSPWTARAMLNKAGYDGVDVTFHDDIFSVRSHGMIEMFALQLLGRPKLEILRDQRSPSRKQQRLQRPPLWHRAIRRVDSAVSPFFDTLCLLTGRYGVITVRGKKPLES